MPSSTLVTESSSEPASAAPTEPAPHDVAWHDVASHDVVIVGGGLVGASLAIALERIGMDVGLVEVAPPNAMGAGVAGVFDQRNLSFSEATVNALSALGVLQKLDAPTASIERIHITRAGDFGRVVLKAESYGRERFGQVVMASDLGRALEARLSELPGIRRYRPARFVGLESLDGEWRGVRVVEPAGDARVLRARLLVGADGTRSGVRDALGIGADQHDYRQTLFVTRLRAEHAPDGTAYERLTEHGPTALLPRGDRHFGLVHAVCSPQADAVAELGEAEFLMLAQQAFGWRVGRFVACGQRSRYPALRLVARHTIAPRALLVGNAAQSLHPIGAQGFNLGLRDALTLSELIQVSRDERARNEPASGFDCGDPTLLQDYVRRRQQDREETLSFSDGLARLSARAGPIARVVRTAGLFAAGRVAAAQSRLVGGALGYRGEVPAICRGDR